MLGRLLPRNHSFSDCRRWWAEQVSLPTEQQEPLMEDDE